MPYEPFTQHSVIFGQKGCKRRRILSELMGGEREREREREVLLTNQEVTEGRKAQRPVE
jgi:hypothetical protein